jgi:alpha-amylase
MMLARPLVVALAAAVTITGLTAACQQQPRPSDASLSAGRDVIASMFSWNWPSIQRECTDFLGPRGYGAVKTSPPQEHIVRADLGYPWWEIFQPVSYLIDSRFGARQQFSDMVAACHRVGVKVYVDTIINHMTGQAGGGVGSAGTRFPDKYTYPGTYQYSDFHHNNCTVTDYTNRWQVQNCELLELADLATESDYVRGRLAGYLNDLLSLNVDGFLFDAAKHVPVADIAAVESRLSRPTYIYQEALYSAGEAVQPTEYTSTGDVLDGRYGRDLGRVFKTGRLALLSNFGEAWGYLPSDKALVYLDNWDTQREGGDILTFRDDELYAMGSAFELAWPYGKPDIMTSFAFSSRDQGPPSDASGRVTDANCGNGRWICEHRWQAIANMVGFHNTVQGTPVTDWWTNGGNQIAFGRGNAGYLVINREGGPLNRTFQTRLPEGRYCDLIHGDLTDGRCTGPILTVEASGRLDTQVNAMDMVALDTAARIP